MMHCTQAICTIEVICTCLGSHLQGNSKDDKERHLTKKGHVVT